MILDPKTRLRLRRVVRTKKRQVSEASLETDKQLDRLILRRFGRLQNVRRFVVMWLLLIGLSVFGVFLQGRLLVPYYQEVRATPGGTYREAVIGSYTNANPLYASGSVDNAVSKLVFSSLFTYDRYNQLVPDIAVEYEFDETGLEYHVTIRDDVYWHDGKQLTAADVAYTYQLIANPDARSPLFSAWSETTVEQVDDFVVRFELPSPFVAFPIALTNGIVPKHIVEDIPVRQLRSHVFNTVQPVGSGPFALDTIEVSGTGDEREERLALRSHESYHRGKPNIDRFIVRTYQSEGRALEAFARGDVYAVSGIDSTEHDALDGVDFHEYKVTLAGQVGVFFKTSEPVFESRAVRRALVQMIDVEAVLSGLDGHVERSDSPLLPIHQGYDDEIVQLPYDPEAAIDRLEEAGWQRDDDDRWRNEDDEPLAFSIVAANVSDARIVTAQLQEQWHAQGVGVEVALQDVGDMQQTIANHDFVALLHAISIGIDPDVYAFWHSSQAEVLADNRLNFSDYSSTTADESLESGRTRSDDELRSVKYEPFLRQWRSDAPALMLYQPRFSYITRAPIEGFSPKLMNAGTDRMLTAHEWYIRQSRVERLADEY